MIMRNITKLHNRDLGLSLFFGMYSGLYTFTTYNDYKKNIIKKDMIPMYAMGMVIGMAYFGKSSYHLIRFFKRYFKK